MTKIQLEEIRAKDIETFARLETGTAPWGPSVPISLSRARAWAKNPHAGLEDVVLIVARIDGYCAGYIGLVPGRLQAFERIERMNWVSTFFVPPELRNHPIGYLLLRRAIALGYSLAVVEPSIQAEKLSLAVGFRPLRQLTYLELDLLKNRNWFGLPLRAIRRILHRTKWSVPKGLDAAIAQCARPIAHLVLSSLLFLAQRRLGRWQVEELKQLPVAASPTSVADVRFVRDRALLEWMLEYPWVTTIRDGDSAEYYFIDYRKQSFHRAYEIREEGALKPSGWAIVWFEVREERRSLHVLDYELPPSVVSIALLMLALREARKHGANRVCIPLVCELALERLAPLSRLFTKKRRRYFLRPQTGSASQTVLDDILLRDADGDFSFA